MERLFKLSQNGTSVKTEVIAGLVTFISMAYILAVNPSILSAAGMDAGAVFTATAISAAGSTLIMAFMSNYPIAVASGMGLNAYFAYSVCVPLAQAGVDNPWEVALAAVLCEGIIFVILTLSKYREALVNDVPTNLKYGISCGIGLFIALDGLIGAGIVVSDASTTVTFGSIQTPQVALALCGIIVIAILHHYNVTGYILWGILVTWLFGMLAQVIGWYVVDPAAGAMSLFPEFGGGINITAPYFCAFDFGYIFKHIADFAVIVFVLLFSDLFDTAGTLIAVGDRGGLLDSEGKLPRARQALMADSIGTILGAVCGTSTQTSFVESTAGTASGGRTGLTGVVVAILFLLALPLSPIFLAIPSFAIAPAMVYVGLLMFMSASKLDFESDRASAISAFLCIVMMPFTYNIANGIMFGFLSYVIIRVAQGRASEISTVMWISAAIFIARIVTMVLL